MTGRFVEAIEPLACDQHDIPGQSEISGSEPSSTFFVTDIFVVLCLSVL